MGNLANKTPQNAFAIICEGIIGLAHGAKQRNIYFKALSGDDNDILSYFETT